MLCIRMGLPIEFFSQGVGNPCQFFLPAVDLVDVTTFHGLFEFQDGVLRFLPRGDGEMPINSKRPMVLLPDTISRSPCRTWIETAG